MSVHLDTNPTTVLRKFPSRQALIYMGIQMLTGLIFQFIPFGQYTWILELFNPIDARFAAFRTMFWYAPDQVAGKAFLMVWWVVFIPWGLLWTARFTNGFQPSTSAHSSYTSPLPVIKLLLLTCPTALALIYVNAFWIYSTALPLHVRNRGDIIPALVSGGPLTGSMWLSLCSFVFIITFYGVVAPIRLLFQQTYTRK